MILTITVTSVNNENSALPPMVTVLTIVETNGLIEPNLFVCRGANEPATKDMAVKAAELLVAYITGPIEPPAGSPS